MVEKMNYFEDVERYGKHLKLVEYRNKLIDIRKKISLLYSGGPKRPVYHYKIITVNNSYVRADYAESKEDVIQIAQQEIDEYYRMKESLVSR